MSLAHSVANEGQLVVTQSNASALRDLRNSLLRFGGGLASILICALYSVHINTASAPAGSTGTAPFPSLELLFFFSLPFLWLVIRSINRLFGKETFVFDKKEQVFIRNGFTVGPLQDIRKVTAQVTKGLDQNPMFRLVLELPQCQTVVIATTHYIPNAGEFSLSQNGFGNPNKSFAVFEEWRDCDKQTLVPFIPPEIDELREKIVGYLRVQQEVVLNYYWLGRTQKLRFGGFSE